MWLTTERARNRLAAEKPIFSAAIDGDIPLCLIYPNEYAVGMSNLGFQAAYKIFTQHESCRCERAFLPDPDEARRAEADWCAASLTRDATAPGRF